jgi:preprotein translocase subunit SecB
MDIRLVNTKVSQLFIEEIPDEKELFNLGFSIGYSTENAKEFVVIFDLEMTHKNNYFFKLKYLSTFEKDENIDEAFKESFFPKVNAPAIAYPFLRAYVANLMLSSGFEPFLLPTINFTKLTPEKTLNVIQSA